MHFYRHTGNVLMTMTWLRWLVASHSLQRLMFIPRLVYVVFVVNGVALGQGFL